ncbi:leucine-rich repeat protein [Porcipelethomonas sp.]|uniref:leucine-rich repeat protein n=1 Tax=Porcipelethomonas sp. TaxID=2981675 RepID=UPI003EF74432
MKRKIIVAVLVAIMAFSMSFVSESKFISKNIFNTITANAAETTYTSGSYTYTLSDSYATITGYSGNDTTLTIPTKLNGYSVNAIGNYSFVNKSFQALNINSNIKSIGNMAFGNCANLTAVKIYGSPTIGNWVFDGCKSLKNVTLSNGIKSLGIMMFNGCTSLETIKLPSSLTSMGTSVFANCTALKSITIPSTMQTIPQSAFSGCTALTTITLPEGLKEIGENAFSNCTSLSNLSLPSTLITINRNAFKNDTAITGKLTLPSGLENIKDGAFHNCGIAFIVIPGDTILGSAFTSCSKLSEITISGNAILGNTAFGSCTNLININVPIKTTYTWGDTTFNGCKNLQYINGSKVTLVNPKTSYGYFNSAVDEFVRKYFIGSTNVGFIDSYVAYTCDYVIRNTVTSSMSDLEKAKALHDWVLNKVDYDYDNTIATKNHVDSSIFLNDTTVCEGFARGYVLLMNAAGIETKKVGNTDHVWNIVNIGNLYFHIDCCWDEGNENTSNKYKYFMKSDAEIKEIGGTSHSYWSSGSPKCSYGMGDVNMDGTVDNQDVTILQNYILAKITMNSDQCILSDLNFDGQINVFDLTVLKQRVSQS